MSALLSSSSIRVIFSVCGSQVKIPSLYSPSQIIPFLSLNMTDAWVCGLAIPLSDKIFWSFMSGLNIAISFSPPNQMRDLLSMASPHTCLSVKTPSFIIFTVILWSINPKTSNQQCLKDLRL